MMHVQANESSMSLAKKMVIVKSTRNLEPGDVLLRFQAARDKPRGNGVWCFEIVATDVILLF